MALKIFTRAEFSSGISNSTTLSKLSTDTNGNLTFNGKVIASNSIETGQKFTISNQEIRQKFLELPEDCDTSRIITLALNGLSLEQGEYWDIEEKTAPSKDLITWAGLELEGLLQAGDKILVSYYRR